MHRYELSTNEVLEHLKVNPEKGLTHQEAKIRLKKYGENILEQPKKISFFKKLMTQFSDFMVITLIIAAIISLITSVLSNKSDYTDSIIIISIVIINSVIGILQENKAEKDIESLKKLVTPLTKVVRQGKQIRICSKNVVPGDVIILNTGDLVSADARILKCTNLAVEESAMTGEAFSVHKSTGDSALSSSTHGEKENMIFAGSVVTRGRAKAVVVSTGMNTEIGEIASMVSKETNNLTPLQKKLADTGKILGICIMLVSILVFILGIIQKVDAFEMFMISISLAVAAIPEGLPAVVTVVLANGVRRMAKHHTIVRKLPAIETLGHATVICSDKTGTLTANKMVVHEIHSVNQKESISSQFSKKVFSMCSLCNNAVMSRKNGTSVPEGEPTESALMNSALELEIDIQSLKEKYPRLKEIPFDSNRKLMTTIHKEYGGNGCKIITKGAPDVLIKICSKYIDDNGDIKNMNESAKSKIKQTIELMAKKALRIIAVAYKDNITAQISDSECEKDLIFCAVIGIMDPPRPEVKGAIEKCKNAGIRTIMITGDHAETAKSIAKSIGIASHDVLTGIDIDSLSENQLKEKVKRCSVFARVAPKHKVRIVKALQANGEIVAMTGDGVNDAPALKIANIGCAMGQSGTDVAKSASDLILADDNFTSVVEAIRQGRGIYDNIKKTIHFLLSTNISEVMVVLLAFLIGIPSPLLALHLLWLNLVTDAFPALALGMEPIEKDIMKHTPNDSKKSLFSDGLGYNILIEGTFIAAIGLLAYSIGKVFYDFDSTNPIIGRTMAFLTLGISQIVHTFNVRSSKPLRKIGFFGNVKLVYAVIICITMQIVVVTVPQLIVFFKTSPLNFGQWLIVLILSFMPILISETEKYFINSTKTN